MEIRYACRLCRSQSILESYSGIKMSEPQWLNDVPAIIEWLYKRKVSGKKSEGRRRYGSSEERAIREVKGRCIMVRQGEGPAQIRFSL